MWPHICLYIYYYVSPRSLVSSMPNYYYFFFFKYRRLLEIISEMTEIIGVEKYSFKEEES